MLDYVNAFLNYTLLTFNDDPLTISEVLAIPVWIGFSYWFIRLILKSVSNRLIARETDPNTIQLTQRVIFISAIAVVFMTTLSMLNVPIAAFAFLSGAIAIGFGFGAQNIINNFISGWILIGEKPIRIGDFLEVEGVKGVVEEINTRSTRVRRTDGVHLLIPNSKLLENTVVNWTLRDRLIRGTVRIGVQYGSDCEKVTHLMLEATKANENVLETPPPAVFFQDFGDNALIFEVFFWINSSVDGGLRGVSSEIRYHIDKTFKADNIVIAYPQRDIHIDGALKIERG
ncbi:mechanosensitive ion channel family protein [Thalassotalea sp. PS06]|uniref:mechanosensitive ion channel family protein n=1 Tax=Thalassotalea sp. PS06 TaxID=2594005 RepID=UPI001161E2A3|nr:mechanosensitive ion channel domain-containing protein [Thalassotalea sp. PS06]QDP01552.1 mechanosensitive ion channel [Thalassotalea sp. PS06]